MASSGSTTDATTTTPGAQSPGSRIALAVGVYLCWTVATWALEGRLLTLQRPGAAVDRLAYTAVANVLIGTLVALWVVRVFAASGAVSRARLGLRSLRHTLLASVGGAAAGFALYLVQGPPTTDPVVLANAFAQMLPVSIAEIVVCWMLVGGSVEAALRGRVPDVAARTGALVAASILFGLYHFAHSPPFDTTAMVGLLTLVSVGTGAVFFGGRSAYGALVFHNFLALFGVTSALADAGRLVAYRDPAVSLLVTGLVALLIFVVAESLGVRDASGSTAGNDGSVELLRQ